MLLASAVLALTLNCGGCWCEQQRNREDLSSLATPETLFIGGRRCPAVSAAPSASATAADSRAEDSAGEAHSDELRSPISDPGGENGDGGEAGSKGEGGASHQQERVPPSTALCRPGGRLRRLNDFQVCPASDCPSHLLGTALLHQECSQHQSPGHRRRTRDDRRQERGRWEEQEWAASLEQLSIQANSNSSTTTCRTAVARRRKSEASKPEPPIIQSEPPSPGHSYYGEGAGVQLINSPRHQNLHHDLEREKTPGCCSSGAMEPHYASLSHEVGHGHGKDPPLSTCVRNLMNWMAEKAERGTSALREAMPSLSKEDYHVVMIGLDGAGKTTALYRMKFDQYVNTVPTIGFNCERVKGTMGRSRGLTFLVWDVGGQEKIRPLWRSYTRCTDGIIFVVDSAQPESLEEARVELWRTMR